MQKGGRAVSCLCMILSIIKICFDLAYKMFCRWVSALKVPRVDPWNTPHPPNGLLLSFEVEPRSASVSTHAKEQGHLLKRCTAHSKHYAEITQLNSSFPSQEGYRNTEEGLETVTQ